MSFDYQIYFKKRKSISITIDKDASVIVSAPRYIPKKYIDNFIKSKSSWIEKNLQKIKEHKKIIKKGFYNGEEFQYLGNKIKLTLSDKYFKGIKFDGGNFYISKSNIDNGNRLFHEFYFNKANEILKERTIFYAKKYNFNINNLRISNANTRWGSCNIKKDISLNWKLVMADIKIIDYVIIHELAHTVEHNHSKNFWKIVEDIIPDYKEKRIWLRKNGDLLDIK